MYVLKLEPQQQVFADLLDANHAMDVARPAMAKQAIGNRSAAASALGDAGIKVMRDFAHRMPIKSRSSQNFAERPSPRTMSSRRRTWLGQQLNILSSTKEECR